MKTFKHFIREMNVASAGGVFGTGGSFEFGGAVGNSDFYAPGDARLPKVLGIFKRTGKVAKNKKGHKFKTNALKRKSKR
jgi:hypothetical protein